jgi:pimeloyl-ACP methyl ester carboxylesterase
MPYAQSSAYRIHYEVEGAGPPLLLHMGNAFAAHDWYDFGYVEALKDDYRLILLDPLGQGESDRPHSTEAYISEAYISASCRRACRTGCALRGAYSLNRAISEFCRARRASKGGTEGVGPAARDAPGSDITPATKSAAPTSLEHRRIDG